MLYMYVFVSTSFFLSVHLSIHPSIHLLKISHNPFHIVCYMQMVLCFIPIPSLIIEELLMFLPPGFIKYNILYLFNLTLKIVLSFFVPVHYLHCQSKRVTILGNSIKGKARTSNFTWKVDFMAVSQIYYMEGLIRLKITYFSFWTAYGIVLFQKLCTIFILRMCFTIHLWKYGYFS